MPFNGSGIFQKIYSWTNDAASGINIRADRMDNQDADMATGLSTCITKDGQTTITANLPMAGYRHTSVGDASARTQYASFGQLQDGKANWVAAGGTADAITATYPISIGTLVDGQEFYVRSTAANTTTTPTFSPNGNTARTIVKNGNAALAVGDIPSASYEMILRYRLSDTKYVLLNPADTSSFVQSISVAGTTTEAAYINLFEDTDNGTNKVKFQAPAALAADITVTLPAVAGTLLVDTQVPVIRGYIDGYQLSTAGASTTMTIGAGQATDSTNSTYLSGVSINKTTSAWAVGTGNGGLDTGSIANTTWYHFYAIRRPDTGVVDVLFSTSATSPTLPANYTQFRRIGAWKTNGSGQWDGNIIQNGDQFRWKNRPLDLNVSNPGSAAVTRTLASVPTGIELPANININVYDTNVLSVGVLITALDETANTPTSYGAGADSDSGMSASSGTVVGSQIAGFKQVRTNTSAQVRTQLSSNVTVNTVLNVRVLGWNDPRGKQ